MMVLKINPPLLSPLGSRLRTRESLDGRRLDAAPDQGARCTNHHDTYPEFTLFDQASPAAACHPAANTRSASAEQRADKPEGERHDPRRLQKLHAPAHDPDTICRTIL